MRNEHEQEKKGGIKLDEALDHHLKIYIKDSPGILRFMGSNYG